MSNTVRTTCPYCGVGCGIEATIPKSDDGKQPRIVTVTGDKEHPANLGRLCVKGSALGDTVSLKNRLLHPMVEGEQTDWDHALSVVSDKFKQIIQTHGPDSVAFYVSGQILTEDYYVANKLMKGYIGSANIDTNSRLCMSSAVAGHKRAFGVDSVPGCYEDFELADLVVLTGSNLAWCHPVLYQRIAAAKKERPSMKVVNIDPRATPTNDIADLHLPIKPGTDSHLFNGLLAYLAQQGKIDYLYLEQNTEGFGQTIASAQTTNPNLIETAKNCGIPESLLSKFFHWFSSTDKTVTIFSQGINQSSSGSDKVNSIINCHLATGRIGQPGMGPFSITGQPNAMGGREVGGLANQLAAHMDFSDEHKALVSEFWQTNNLAPKPGLKAVELFEAIERGDVKAVWIMATNPVVSLPNANQVKAALEKCEMVVVSDAIYPTDTGKYANVLLPAATWGEKDGTVTNSERRISRQRGFFELPADVKPDWWVLTQVAHRMGYKDAFDYTSPADIFREHARLSGYKNNDERDFDISGLQDLSDEQYDTLEPIQWPVNEAHPYGQNRLYSDSKFYTGSRRARLIPIVPKAPGDEPNEKFPLVLNTGRIRDHWHTMTRTGLSPRLSNHILEPFVQVHPNDAAKYQLINGDLAKVTTMHGEMNARIEVTDTQRKGEIFIPIHWTEQMSKRGRVGALVNPFTDPTSGQPEFKHTPAYIEPLPTTMHGFILCRDELRDLDSDYWVKVTGDNATRYEIASNQTLPTLLEQVKSAISQQPNDDIIEFKASREAKYRFAIIREDRLYACVFINNTIDLPSRQWLSGLFAKEKLSPDQRMSLLAGVPPKGEVDCGKAVCSCFGVGENTIKQAIRKGANSVEAIGKALNAGTNCGSCIPEIRALLDKTKA